MKFPSNAEFERHLNRTNPEGKGDMAYQMYLIKPMGGATSLGRTRQLPYGRWLFIYDKPRFDRMRKEEESR